MSAPLVINLRDGSVWERRAMTAAGVALYALAGSCTCREYLMASESELAAQGIAGTADVLPVPVGPEASLPQGRERAELLARYERALAPFCVNPGAAARAVGEVRDHEAEFLLRDAQRSQDRVNALEAAAYGDAEVRLLSPVEQIRHLHACVAAQLSRAGTLDRLCREQRARADAAGARVEALLVERHSTNESLDEALQELRLLNTQRGDVGQLIERERGEGEECVDIDALESALGLGSDELVEAGESS